MPAQAWPRLEARPGLHDAVGRDDAVVLQGHPADGMAVGWGGAGVWACEDGRLAWAGLELDYFFSLLCSPFFFGMFAVWSIPVGEVHDVERGVDFEEDAAVADGEPAAAVEESGVACTFDNGGGGVEALGRAQGAGPVAAEEEAAATGDGDEDIAVQHAGAPLVGVEGRVVCGGAVGGHRAGVEREGDEAVDGGLGGRDSGDAGVLEEAGPGCTGGAGERRRVLDVVKGLCVFGVDDTEAVAGGFGVEVVALAAERVHNRVLRVLVEVANRVVFDGHFRLQLVRGARQVVDEAFALRGDNA